MKRSEFVFDSVDLLYYKLHKISLKNKKARINPKNNGDKCFQYAITAALNHQNIKNNLQRISNIEPFTDQYNWK